MLEKLYKKFLPEIAEKVSWSTFSRIGSTGDIVLSREGAFGGIGTRRYQVDYRATTIYPGEPVYAVMSPTLTGYVAPFVDASPTSTLKYVVGIAENTSTQTTTAAGYVDVFPAVPGVIYTIPPTTAATYGLTAGSESQGTYNALVGSRVTIQLSGGAYTINATDATTNGCVVENTDVFKAGGRVSFSFRQGYTYFA
jgi:hypothetical protein